MTDYIVANCETAAFNGTYEYDDGTYGLTSPDGDVWIKWDGNGHTVPDNVIALISSDNISGILYITDPGGTVIYNSGHYDNILPPPDDPSIVWLINDSDPSALTVTAAGGSAQNLTLSCAAGSYSQTGSACTLTYTPAAQNLTLSCGAGSLALTGSACTLSVKRNFALAASAGSYAVTGTSASLTKNLVLSCESGGVAYPNIVVSGAGTSEVNGVYAEYGTRDGKTRYRMASTGSPSGYFYIVWIEDYLSWIISHRGEDATSDLIIASASYYISTDAVTTPDLCTNWTQGSNGVLPLPTVTSPPATSYALTGSSVTLTKSLVLSCETGSYALTGTSVTLEVKRNFTLACASGSYAVTGSAVTFAITRAYTLACSAGSYALTGSDVSFGNTKAYELVCVAGSYALTGTPVSLASARSLACNSGSYVLTGLEADLFKRLVMPCGNGSYILTGSPATINSARTFVLGMGSYVLVGTDAGLYIPTPTPDCRRLTIHAEDRTLTIPREDRTLTIPREDRTLKIKCCD